MNLFHFCCMYWKKTITYSSIRIHTTKRKKKRKKKRGGLHKRVNFFLSFNWLFLLDTIDGFWMVKSNFFQKLSAYRVSCSYSLPRLDHNYHCFFFHGFSLPCVSYSPVLNSSDKWLLASIRLRIPTLVYVLPHFTEYLLIIHADVCLVSLCTIIHCVLHFLSCFRFLVFGVPVLQKGLS